MLYVYLRIILKTLYFYQIFIIEFSKQGLEKKFNKYLFFL